MRRGDDATEDPPRIEELWRSVHGRLRRAGADGHTADDLAQETWLIALARPPEERGRLRSWLHVVAGRLWAHDRRARRPALDVELDGLATEATDEPEPPELARLARCVDELPARYREVVRMHYFEGLGLPDVARVLRITPDAARARLKRGLARLRRRLERRSAPREGFGFAGLLGLLRRRRPTAQLRLAESGLAIACAGALLTTILASDPARGWSAAAASPLAHAGARDGDGVRVAVAAAAARTELRGREAPLRASVAARERGLAGLVRTPDGAPLGGASVYVADAEGEPRVAAVTAQDGAFRLDGTLARSELVWAGHAEWCESPRVYLAAVLAGEAATSGLELVLTPTRGKAAVRVRSADGGPVANARVLVDARAEREQRVGSGGTLELAPRGPVATTDADGRAALLLPESETIEVSVVAHGFPAWSERIRTPDDGVELGIDLPAPLALEGVCIAPDGSPSWNARVEVVQHGGLARAWTTTGTDGRFRLESLAVGPTSLRAADETGSSARHDFFLPPDGTGPVTLELDERCTVRGVVRDGSGPVVGARVVLETATPSSPERRTASTDGAGRFRFPACLPRATHSLLVFAPGAEHASAGTNKLRPGGGERTFVLAEDGEPRAPLEIVCSAASGLVPRLVELRRQWRPLPISCLVTSADGERFVSPPLPAGVYSVVAWHPELGTWAVQDVVHDPHAPLRHDLAIPDPGTLEIEFDLSRSPAIDPARLEVAVTSERLALDGPDLVGARATRRILPRGTDPRVHSSRIPAGTYEVLVVGQGIAETRAAARVEPGRTTRSTVTPRPGRNVVLTLVADGRPGPQGTPSRRSLLPREEIRVTTFAPGGATRLLILGRDLRMSGDTFEVPVALPADATSIEVVTESPPEALLRQSVRSGQRALAPGELDSTEPPRIEVVLVDTD